MPVCNFWQQGKCKFGDQCKNDHFESGEEDLVEQFSGMTVSDECEYCPHPLLPCGKGGGWCDQVSHGTKGVFIGRIRHIDEAIREKRTGIRKWHVKTDLMHTVSDLRLVFNSALNVHKKDSRIKKIARRGMRFCDWSHHLCDDWNEHYPHTVVDDELLDNTVAVFNELLDAL